MLQHSTHCSSKHGRLPLLLRTWAEQNTDTLTTGDYTLSGASDCQASVVRFIILNHSQCLLTGRVVKSG